MDNDDKILSELVAIKKLLIAIMLKNDYTQTEVANVIGVDQSVISRMINTSKKTSKGASKKIGYIETR